MFGLSAAHLIILAVVVLIFGSRKLPELGESLGKGLRSFREGMDGQEDEKEEEDKEPKRLEASSDPSSKDNGGPGDSQK